MASASPKAQSMCPPSTIAARCVNWRSSFGCNVKPSGTVIVAVVIRSISVAEMPVSGAGGSSGISIRTGASRTGASFSRTSSSAAWSLALKSSSAVSASSRVRSPRRMSVSV